MQDPIVVLQRIRETGWASSPSVLPAAQVEALRTALGRAYEVCRGVQLANGIGDKTDGTVHHVVGLDPAFVALIDPPPLLETMRAFFGGNFILNSYGGVINLKNYTAYVGRVHRDVRFFTHGQPLMLNMLIALDDFTVDNGATHVLSGSHLRDERPTDEQFFRDAERILVPAGTVVLFDSNLWHAAGVNHTDSQRRALTLTFTRPFMKQQLDYPRLFGNDEGDKHSPVLRQLLGYNSRVPASLDEWYQPPERRFYRPDQG